VTGIAEIALFADEPATTIAFYRLLLGSEPVAEWPSGAIFAAGEAKLLVHERSPALDGGPPNDDHFAVGVADVDEACAELRSHGLTLLVEPHDYPWGRSAYLRDPDGRLVELAQE
jgi:catechol 2,3-dioxygenase-like lactoylglutathione lyase family enzyme